MLLLTGLQATCLQLHFYPPAIFHPRRRGMQRLLSKSVGITSLEPNKAVLVSCTNSNCVRIAVKSFILLQLGQLPVSNSHAFAWYQSCLTNTVVYIYSLASQGRDRGIPHTLEILTRQ